MNKGYEDLIFKFADELRVSDREGRVELQPHESPKEANSGYKLKEGLELMRRQFESILYYDGYEILSITGTKSAIAFIRWIMERNEEGSSDKIKFTYDEYETSLNITFRPIDIPVNPAVIQRKLEGEGIKVIDIVSEPKVT